MTKYLINSAIISNDGQFRYELVRAWDLSLPVLSFVMLNPSQANATEDDPTVRQCVEHAKAKGFGGIAVYNLFAYKATNPTELLNKQVQDLVGPFNDDLIKGIKPETTTVLAWGAFVDRSPLLKARADQVCKMLEQCAVMCLGVNKAGSPKHPLYIKKIESVGTLPD